jgi:hypothetical protein
MIEKLEPNLNAELPVYTDIELGDKLNEVIDYLNARAIDLPLPTPVNPKWKLGDDCWYVQLISGSSNKWKTELVSVNEFMLAQIKDGDENLFKTREQAETALAEIKNVLRRYQ